MSKYWALGVSAARRTGGFNPDYARCLLYNRAMRATPKATWKVRCKDYMKPFCMDTDQTSEALESKLVFEVFRHKKCRLLIGNQWFPSNQLSHQNFSGGCPRNVRLFIPPFEPRPSKPKSVYLFSL